MTEENPAPLVMMKAFPFCAEPILAAAKKCRYCGEFLPVEGTEPPPRRVESAPRWNLGVAAVLSLVIPGTGQMYGGGLPEGLLLFFMVSMLYSPLTTRIVVRG